MVNHIDRLCHLLLEGYDKEVMGSDGKDKWTEDLYSRIDFTDEEAALSLRMMDYWTNFAKTGSAIFLGSRLVPCSEILQHLESRKILKKS